MNSHKDIEDKIDQYLKGKLSDSELQDFEKDLMLDQELDSEVQDAKMIQQLVLKNRLLEVKDMAIQAEKGLNSVSNNLIRILAAGAFLTGLIITTIMYFKNPDDTSIKESQPEERTEQVKPAIHLKSSDSTSPISSETKGLETEKVIQGNTGKNSSAHILRTESQHIETLGITQVLAADSLSNKPNTVIDSTDTKEIIKSDISAKKPVLAEPKTISCEEVKIEATINTTSTCSTERNGQILVEGIGGGNAPYSQKILTENGNQVFSTRGLEAGNYLVLITDVNGCQKDFPTKIESRSCPINASFNPGYGEVWEIPVSEKGGKLKVYSRAGTPLFEKSLSANTKETWNGRNKYDRIEAGYYIFVIQYKDGTVLKGSVTITL